MALLTGGCTSGSVIVYAASTVTWSLKAKLRPYVENSWPSNQVRIFHVPAWVGVNVHDAAPLLSVVVIKVCSTLSGPVKLTFTVAFANAGVPRTGPYTR